MHHSAGIFRADDYIVNIADPIAVTKGILAAIEAARAWGEGATVMLDKGEYRVAWVEGPGDYVFNLDNLQNMTVRGMGLATRLVITSPAKGGFKLAYCENVTIRDMVIDYDPVPFTQGRIVAVDPSDHAFELQLDAGFPSLGAEFIQQSPKPFGRFGLFMEPEKRQIKTGAPDFIFIEDWVDLGEGLWRVNVDKQQSNKLEDVVPGDRYVQLARYGHAVVFFDRAKRCTLRNLVVHTGPGVSIGSMGADDIRFHNYAVRFPEGTGRLLTTNADGLHMQANVKGPTVEGCYFEGMADDAINIYQFPNYIAQVNSATEIEANFGNLIYEGDELTFFNGRSGRIKGHAVAVKVENLSEQDFGPKRITIDPPMEGLTPGDNNKDADTILNNTRCGAGFSIENNVFRDHRRYAMMIKAPGGVIRGNYVENLGGFAIMIGNDADWPEGALPTNVVVRNNYIVGGGHSKYYANYDNAASIMVQTKSLGSEVAQDIGVHAVEISNNTIIDPPGAGIFLGSVRDVALHDNTVIYRPLPYKRSPGAALRVDNAQATTIDGLHVISTDPLIGKAIEDFADKGESTLTTRDIHFETE